MAKGTDAGLLDSPRPQSVFKHTILDQYAIRFCSMTASKLKPKRAVVVDAFAGRGRFDGGQAASAEQLMLHAQKLRNATQIDVFLVEQKTVNYEVLDGVADEYRGRGLNIVTRHGDCGEHLDEAIALAKGASLFLFIDPCGALLPYDQLKKVLDGRGSWPRTELLMNFNVGLIQRAGGQFKKGQLDLGGLAAADSVCGGDWWREVALRAHIESGGTDWEDAAWAVAREYARRLAGGRNYVVAPVRRQPHHQPVYFLIFITGDPHGLWVFGNAASVAREKWLEVLGPDADAESEMLFPMDTVEDQIAKEKVRALEVITANILAVLADGQAKAVIDHVVDIFGDTYGEARETTFNTALRAMVKAGQVEFVTKGAKPYKHVIRKPETA